MRTDGSWPATLRPGQMTIAASSAAAKTRQTAGPTPAEKRNLVIPPEVYERFRPLVRGEPLLLARGRFERFERNRNVIVDEIVTLAPLARQAAGEAEVRSALPEAHHFGHR